jgi:hypothetical protein
MSPLSARLFFASVSLMLLNPFARMSDKLQFVANDKDSALIARGVRTTFADETTVTVYWNRNSFTINPALR